MAGLVPAIPFGKARRASIIGIAGTGPANEGEYPGGFILGGAAGGNCPLRLYSPAVQGRECGGRH